LEPGVYAAGEGVRVEHVVLVTDDGFQLLSGHTLDL
jgi:Xaa-Pro aminopeptidase